MPALTLSIPVRATLALLLAAAAGAAHAEVAYQAREVVGPAEGPPVWAYALNNTGSVAGNTDDRAWGAPRDSFILKARGGHSSYTAFQPLGAAYSETYGINDWATPSATPGPRQATRPSSSPLARRPSRCSAMTTGSSAAMPRPSTRAAS